MEQYDGLVPRENRVFTKDKMFQITLAVPCDTRMQSNEMVLRATVNKLQLLSALEEKAQEIV